MSRDQLLQSIESWSAQPAVESFGWSLVHFLWQGTAVALALALLLLLLRKATPNVRYLAACAGLLLMALCSLGTLTFSWGPAPHPLGGNRQIAQSLPADRTNGPAHREMTAEPMAPERSLDARPDQRTPSAPPISAPGQAHMPVGLGVLRPLLPWFVAVWLIGVVVLSARLCAGWLWIQRMRRRRVRPATSEWEAKLRQIAQRVCVSHPVRLLESALVEVPVVVGWLKPVILLPASGLVGLSPRQLEAILAHELAHIRRHDYLVNLFQTVIETLLFYHPAVWWVSHTIRAEREACCDEIAAQVCGDRLEYARALTSLEALRGSHPQLVVAANSGLLVNRIRRVVGIPAPQTNRSAWWVIAAIAAGLLAMMATNRSSDVQARSQDDSPAAVSQAKTKNHPNPKTFADNAAATQAPAEVAALDGVVAGVLVKASDQSPVAGARVILRSGKNYYAQSDAEGRFRIDKLPPNPYGYEIWAYQANLIAQKTPVPQLQTAASDVARFAPLRLEMVEGKQAKFIVTSKITGQPIPAAVVRFGYPDRRKVETDRVGTAVVSGLLSQKYDVTIEAQDHAREAPQIDLSNAEPVSGYNIALAQGGIVQGVVVDEVGQPVTEASVVYRESTGSGYHGDAFRTDAQGHFRHRFLPLNKPLNISVQKDKYIDQERDFVLTTSQREMDLPITLARRPKSGAVAGTVTDRSGRPVATATVANYGNRSDPNATTTTDAQGQFLLEDLVAGSIGYEVVVQANGFSPQRLSVEPGTTERPGRVAVKLEPGHAIHGRVVDEQGKPIPHAFVSVRSDVYPIGLGSTIRTDQEGNFAFDSIPADAHFDVSLPSYARLFNVPLKLDGTEPITVTLESPASIRGIVVDAESGKPLSQFRVRLSFSRVKQPNDPQGTYSSELEQGVTFKSDAGQFAVGPLKNGMPLEVTIEADGYQRSVVPRAVASKAEKPDDLKIALKPIDDGSVSTLRGQLLDFEGKAISGAQLRLIVSAQQPLGMNDNSFNWVLIKNGQLAGKPYCDQFLSLTTDAQGRFEFQEIHAGKYLQLAYWGDGVPQGRSLAFDKTRPGTTDKATIKLPQPATIRGSFNRPKFPEAGSIRLSRAQEAGHAYEIKLNDEQSTFEFRDLPPGDYGLVVAAKPVRYSENGMTFFRISPLVGIRFPLKAGESKEVTFAEPDRPQ